MSSEHHSLLKPPSPRHQWTGVSFFLCFPWQSPTYLGC